MSLLLLALAAAAAEPDPLARAKAGEVQCFHPDVLFKTCLSIEAYVPTGPGTYVNRGANAVGVNQPFVIETEVPVAIRGNAVCATMRPEQVMAGKVTAGGAPVPPDRAAAVAIELKKKLASVLNKEICTTYQPTDGSGFIAMMKVAGRPAMPAPFIWVKPSDGWTVAP